jgi:hypothetical protein
VAINNFCQILLRSVAYKSRGGTPPAGVHESAWRKALFLDRVGVKSGGAAYVRNIDILSVSVRK